MNDEKNNKLGRGLSSLLSGKIINTDKDNSFVDKISSEINIGITKIIPNKKQPRKEFDKTELESLSSSIKEKGVIQPILVRQSFGGENYEIVAGERRWRAAQLAGLHSVPVIIKKLTDQEVMEIALVENIQRENLNPVEEAQGYKYLCDQHGYKQEQLSKIIGKSRSHIANMLRLLDLPERILKNLIDKKISIGHARPLIGVENAEELLNKIIKNNLNVRQTEKLVSEKKGRITGSKTQDRDPNIGELEDELSEKIGLRTSISFNKNSTSGSITLYYSNLDQLDDVMKRLKK